MARYVLLLPEGEARWAQASPEERAAQYEVHGRFAALLAERGHKLTGGAELQHSSTATTIRKNEDGYQVTDGPYAETAEHLTGFYSIETDDLDDLVECCKVLAGEDAVELRPVVEQEG